MTSRTSSRWSEVEIQQLIELRETLGLTHHEIADRLGVTNGQVDRQVESLLLEGRVESRSITAPRSRSGSLRSWTTLRNEVRMLYEAGVSHPAMAYQLNITRIQLQSQLRRLFREGLPRRTAR